MLDTLEWTDVVPGATNNGDDEPPTLQERESKVGMRIMRRTRRRMTILLGMIYNQLQRWLMGPTTRPVRMRKRWKIKWITKGHV